MSLIYKNANFGLYYRELIFSHWKAERMLNLDGRINPNGRDSRHPSLKIIPIDKSPLCLHQMNESFWKLINHQYLLRREWKDIKFSRPLGSAEKCLSLLALCASLCRNNLWSYWRKIDTLCRVAGWRYQNAQSARQGCIIFRMQNNWLRNKRVRWWCAATLISIAAFHSSLSLARSEIFNPSSQFLTNLMRRENLISVRRVKHSSLWMHTCFQLHALLFACAAKFLITVWG